MIIKLNVNPDEAAKLQAALADDTFSDALIAMQSPEEVQLALKEKGIALTIEEIMNLAAEINNANKDELNEEALMDVAGGVAGINIYWDYKKGKLNITIVW